MGAEVLTQDALERSHSAIAWRPTEAFRSDADGTLDAVNLDTLFAKLTPIVVTFVWTHSWVKVVDDSSTLAHRCRCGWGVHPIAT
jgi:hypothetical protein